MDYPRGGRDRGRLALSGVVAAADWFGRLDTRMLPPSLSVLYLVGGVASLFVYLLPDMEGLAGMLGIVISIWQGLLLWKSGSGETQTPELMQASLIKPEPGAFDFQSGFL